MSATKAAGAADLDAYRDIWIFVQTDEHDAVASVAFELMGKGRELADARGCRLVALVGMGPEGSLGDLEHLVYAGADEVLACRDERLRQNDAEVYARLICDLVAERKPEAILYGATAFGRELAPGVAVRLQTGLTADCTVLSMDAETGLLQQTRPAFGGNLMATIVCPNHRPQMATVRPGIFKAPDFDYGRSGTITQISLADDAKTRVEISIPAEEWRQQASIADAERLVVVGRGIGSKKNLPLMRRLAEALGAELGCTRPVVEAGWLEYRHQIGQTGVSVSPKLLVSIGVSGAIQHLAGIGGAECIIAINEDPDAPIFGAAQYKVVGDAVEVVEELLAQLER
ncbi:MAG: electron transfer flavoprotein subunit alpha/FixB family protein [Collinsella aerofaciens]